MTLQRKVIKTDHKIKCYKCKEYKTFPNFPFTGRGKCKTGAKGSYRKDTCLQCNK